jgi:hypothetical protein
LIYFFKNEYRCNYINIELIVDFHLGALKHEGVIKEYTLAITHNQYLSNPPSLREVWNWILTKNSTLVVWVFEDMKENEVLKIFNGYGRIHSIVEREIMHPSTQWEIEMVEEVTVVTFT